MIFKLTASRSLYGKEDGERLSTLGIPMEHVTDERYGPITYRLTGGDGLIEIKTLEELMAFVEKWGDVVLSKGTIEIYNGWRE